MAQLNTAGLTTSLLLNASTFGDGGFNLGPLRFSPPLSPLPFTPGVIPKFSIGLPPSQMHTVSGNAAWGDDNGGTVFPSYAAEIMAEPVVAVDTVGGFIDLNIQNIPNGTPLPSQYSSYNLMGGAFNSYPYGQTYGVWEVEAQLAPLGTGVWQCPLWLLPVNQAPGPEIDVCENWLALGASSYQATVHSANAAWLANPGIVTGPGLTAGALGAGSIYFIVTQYMDDQGVIHALPVLSAAQHRYSVQITSRSVMLYFDGYLVAQCGCPPDLQTPLYVVSDLDCGNGQTWNGNLTRPIPSPVTMAITYIQAWAPASGGSNGTNNVAGAVPIQVFPNFGPPLGYQQITSIALATTTKLSPPAAAVYAVITVSGQTVRYRDDGTAPTASMGVPVPAGTTFTYAASLAFIEFIETVSGATLDILYYG